MRAVIGNVRIAHQSALKILVANDEGQLSPIQSVFHPDLIPSHPWVDVPVASLGVVGLVIAAHEIAINQPGLHRPLWVWNLDIPLQIDPPGYPAVGFTIAVLD